MLTDQQAQEISNMEKRASKGPWIVGHLGAGRWHPIQNSEVGVVAVVNDAILAVEENAQFIAHARQDVPTLLADRERCKTQIGVLEAKITDLEGKLVYYYGWWHCPQCHHSVPVWRYECAGCGAQQSPRMEAKQLNDPDQ